MAGTMVTVDAVGSTHLSGIAASDDHAGDSEADRSCGDEAFYQWAQSGSVCAERPGHSRSSGGAHVRILLALPIQATRRTSARPDQPPLKLRRSAGALARAEGRAYEPCTNDRAGPTGQSCEYPRLDRPGARGRESRQRETRRRGGWTAVSSGEKESTWVSEKSANPRAAAPAHAVTIRGGSTSCTTASAGECLSMTSHSSAAPPEPVTSKQTAERVWEPKFLAEIMAGGDPRRRPKPSAPASELTVADFLDRYYTNYVEPEGIKSAKTDQRPHQGSEGITWASAGRRFRESGVTSPGSRRRIEKGTKWRRSTGRLACFARRSTGDVSRTRRCSRRRRFIVLA